MSILERVTELKNQGMSETDISQNLQQEGISPREIDDALSQAQIKNAVYDEEMQAPTQESYAPQTQELEEQYAPESQYPQTQEYYPQEGYGEYASAGIDTSTTMDIAEQVFSKKIKTIQKQVEETTEFKILAQTKIENISERLRRIETTIDKLQLAILDKVGSYGKNLEGIKKEMSMMQSSFGKMVGKTTHHTPVKRKTHRKTRSKKK